MTVQSSSRIDKTSCLAHYAVYYLHHSLGYYRSLHPTWICHAQCDLHIVLGLRCTRDGWDQQLQVVSPILTASQNRIFTVVRCVIITENNISLDPVFVFHVKICKRSGIWNKLPYIWSVNHSFKKYVTSMKLNAENVYQPLLEFQGQLTCTFHLLQEVEGQP